MAQCGQDGSICVACRKSPKRARGLLRTDQFLDNQAELLEKEARNINEIAKSLRRRAGIIRELVEKQGS